MIHKAAIQKNAYGVQQGAETFGALKGMYHAGQIAWGIGRSLGGLGAAAIPFIL
jgi:hypothetical protein